MVYKLNSTSELAVQAIRFFDPTKESLSDLNDISRYSIMTHVTGSGLDELDLPQMGRALIWDIDSWRDSDLVRENRNKVPRTNQKMMADIAVEFSRLKNDDEILEFAKVYGLLGCRLIHQQDFISDVFNYKHFYYHFQAFYEPLSYWEWHIDHVRTLLKWYSQLLDEPNAKIREQLIRRVEWYMRDGIRLTTGNVESNESRLGFVIKESRETIFLLGAIYYDIWRRLTDEKPIKMCKVCGNPFQSVRKDAAVCSKACQKRLDRSRPKGDIQADERGH
ncbi:hypothetical protein [Paenibacillus sp. CF384]|uniref:hypothetical protein n=1 Tax=Paenibacillus sp. CF384 TaxID=1884382 RepID=UPI000895B7CB|nr:hypothetical protein [Paenibacillus sp. CF384]SDX47339.1 hypothetical protein SAMN05518855_1014160 [Paenibacillus sp. CF384]